MTWAEKSPTRIASLEWGAASLALPGHTESGDLHLVAPFPNGVLVAVVDGLGHGFEAAAASKIALATLKEHLNEPVTSLVHRCHERLKGTRGVVMSLASFMVQDGTMTWLGVGNVEGILLRPPTNANPAREWIVLRAGVVGYSLPSLRASVLHVRLGDTLIFATDGIRPSFAESPSLNDSPQRIAERILARSGRDTDDALVLVARYLGGVSR